MMWLGIVLHVATNHITGPMVLPWRDDATSQTADLLVGVIHVFRMPLFLLLAGYFVAMLVERHGAGQMLRHRMRRIALPFAVFWPILFVLTALLVTLYSHRAVHGYFGLAENVVPMLPNRPRINTLHLWFLYQLAGFALLTFVALRLAPHVPLGLREGVSRAFRPLGQRFWGFAVLALPLGLIGAQDSSAVLLVTGSFAPPLGEWIHHGLFYAFGYFAYSHRQALLAHYQANAARLLLAGFVLCMLSLAMIRQARLQPEAAGFAFRFVASWGYNAASWLWCFALLGLGLRHLNHQNAALGYLAESAYWVYMVHMLGTIGFGALLYGAPLPAELKIVLNIAATTAMCLGTYQLFVRHTAIGELLNGKRAGHSRIADRSVALSEKS